MLLNLCTRQACGPHRLRRAPSSSGDRRRRRSRIAAASPDPLTALSRALWGRALPPAPLVLAVRRSWAAAWRLLMRQLAPSDPASGAFTRSPAAFPAVAAPPSPRLHLYVGLPCPWAHRALLARALLRLHDRLPVSVAVPGDDGAWSFTPRSPDALYGKRKLREVYAARSGGFEGRATVPMLWDAARREVVCNESIEIAKFLCGLAADAGGNGIDLYPPELRHDIDRWYDLIYPSVNNGVYRSNQQLNEHKMISFAGDDDDDDDDAGVGSRRARRRTRRRRGSCSAHLGGARYLCGGRLTLADVCLFTTLVRFDAVYNPLFRCSRRKLAEYPALHAYTRDIYQLPGVADTCDMDAIMAGYFRTLFPLNPGGIQPLPPASCGRDALLRPHGREALSSAAAAGAQAEAAGVP
ncbi:hypothetical protein ACP4OV_016084 [Aristida adscensionis]